MVCGYARLWAMRSKPRPARVVLALVAAALAAGCHGDATATVHLRKEPGFDGAWIASKDGRIAALDATGDVTKLKFQGKTFTFRGLTRFHGRINPDSVHLLTDSYVIEMSPESFSIEGRRRRYVRPLAALPDAPVVVFEDGNFFLE
jgi:hypothetical protein